MLFVHFEGGPKAQRGVLRPLDLCEPKKAGLLRCARYRNEVGNRLLEQIQRSFLRGYVMMVKKAEERMQVFGMQVGCVQIVYEICQKVKRLLTRGV